MSSLRCDRQTDTTQIGMSICHVNYYNPDSRYAYGRKLVKIHQANREINTWRECRIDKSNTACKVIPDFEAFVAKIWKIMEKNKPLWEGTQGCVPGPENVIDAEIKGDTAGKITRQSNNANRTESEKNALIEKHDGSSGRRYWVRA